MFSLFVTGLLLLSDATVARPDRHAVSVTPVKPSASGTVKAKPVVAKPVVAKPVVVRPAATKPLSHPGAKSVTPPLKVLPAAPVVVQVPVVTAQAYRQAPMPVGLIDLTLAQVQKLLGKPVLEVWEDEARKLQYRGKACVLDIYFYPEDAGRLPRSTYVDARRPDDGRSVDRAACLRYLRQGIIP